MRVRGLLAFALIIIVAVATLFGVFWFRSSWVNVGVGTAMLIVDASTGVIGPPILGPTAGFYIDGFKRLIGLQYPVFIFVATDTFEDVIPCFSSDQLEVQIEILMRWDLDPSKIQALYSNYPNLNYKGFIGIQFCMAIASI